MLFLEYGSRKKKLLIFMCVLVFCVCVFFFCVGVPRQGRGQPSKGCPYLFCKSKITGCGRLTRWIKLRWSSFRLPTLWLYP